MQFAEFVSTAVKVYWPGVVVAREVEFPEPAIGVVLPFWVKVQVYVEPTPPFRLYRLPVEFSQMLAGPEICRVVLGEGSTVTWYGTELPKQFTKPVLDSFTTMLPVPGVVQFTEMVLPTFEPTIVPPVTVQAKDEPGVGLFMVY